MTRLDLTVVLALVATPAAAFVAENDLVVRPGSGGEIAVPFGGSADVTDYWCAAADYARRELGAGPTDRLYRVSPPPRRQGEGISFSLTRPDAPVALSFLASQTGEMSLSHARSYCQPKGPYFDLLD